MTSLFARTRAQRSLFTPPPDPWGMLGNPYWSAPLPAWRQNEEIAGSGFAQLVAGAYQGNAVVFACELTRLALFSEARFQFRQVRNGRPGDLFGNRDLSILERPWPGGTTGDLLSKMLLDADLGGSAFVARRAERPDRLMRMRPDWVTIVLGSQDEPEEAGFGMDVEFLGVIFHPGGIGGGRPVIPLLADEVAFWTPYPDPLAHFRGTSWLVPIIPEIEADLSATQHKLMFFKNGATPQLVMSMGPGVTPENLEKFVAKMEADHAGSGNAYRTLYVGGGASVEAVGRDLAQLDFRATQGAGETRIAAASGVHPVVAALSEGLSGSSLNAGNFGAARRIVADRTLRPLWRGACAALATLVEVPSDAELWFDERDISFLQEDRKDAADIQFVMAQTIRQYVDAQFEPESAVKAVQNQDPTLLKHSGRLTVQGQSGAPAAATPQNGPAPQQPAPPPVPTQEGGQP